MIQKESLSPIYLAGLVVAFGVISFLVYLTRGNPALVKKKLKLGGIIIAMTGVISGCGHEEAMCYVPSPASNEFSLSHQHFGDNGLAIDLTQSSTLSGGIDFRSGNEFSYRLTSEVEVEKQRGDIQALDNAFDEDSEEFEINLQTNLESGLYMLNFYEFSQEDQPDDPDQFRNQFQLFIENEN